MSDILQRILAVKAEEVGAVRAARSLAELELAAVATLTAGSPLAPRGFARSLQLAVSSGRSAVIAEVKRASPSKGLLRDPFLPREIVLIGTEPFYERAAINAPIQGSAADIIRRAMVRMDDALAEARLSAQMLLQVHDELVFETPEGDADKALSVIRPVMEHAASPAVGLRVPLRVDAHAAANWEAAH